MPGRGLDLESVRAPFIKVSNSCFTETGTSEAFLVLDRLLCRQSTTRAPGDRDKAIAALEDLRRLVVEHNGIAEFYIHAMEARIAVYSGKPAEAKKCYELQWRCRATPNRFRQKGYCESSQPYVLKSRMQYR